MSPKKDSSNTKALALGGTIALGALIAYNLPSPTSKSHSKPTPRAKAHHSPTPSPPPPWRNVPPLITHPHHYREERYYLRYGSGEGPGDLLCVVDQRPVDGSVKGPEVRGEHDAKSRGFEVERYYSLNEEEAGPHEAHRIVKTGYPKWDR